MKVVAVTAFGAALLLAACGSDAAQGEPIEFWDGQELNSFQREVAADGVVSRAEYEDAYERARTCVTEEGWGAEITLTPSGNLQLAAVSSGAANTSSVEEALDHCAEEWVGPLEPIYSATTVAQGAERDAEFVKWQECMTSQGGDVTGVVLGMRHDETMSQLESTNGTYPSWPLAWATCVEKYYFVLWPESIPGA